jgi:2-oxo-4-hydroxy-4-carboxy-5-ureidoimidazoline decarboxylase
VIQDSAAPDVPAAAGPGLARFNSLPEAEAVDALLACCAVRGWARAVAGRRPYESADRLLVAGGEQFDGLGWDAIETAVAAHPRIGDRVGEGAGAGSGWSRQEQAGAGDAPSSVRAALLEGNLAYETRFGRTFLICATGLTAAEMLRRLTERLEHDEQAERGVVREELRAVTLLRLGKLAEGGTS